MANKNDHLVVAYFPTFEVAEGAAKALKEWDKANKDIKLGAIGLLQWDSDFEKVVAKEIGERDAKKGALWGAGIGAAAGILTAGIALIPGLLIGAAAGGGAGALNHKSLGMSDADKDKLDENLRNGGVALAVMADDFEVAATEAELARLGGTSTTFDVPEETADIIVETVEVQDEVEKTMGDRAIEVKEEAVAMMVAAPALGAASVVALQDAEVSDMGELQTKAATAAGRAELVKATGMDRAAVDAIAYDLDLSRVRGVGRKSLALLKAAGIESVGDLAEYDPDELAGLLVTVNEQEHIVENMPSRDTIAGWVEQARDLPPYLVAVKVLKEMMNVDDYEWHAQKGDDPTKTRKDAIMFNRKEGYEVKLMLQKICDTFGFETVDDVKRVEAVIATELPGNVRSQKNVYNWLVTYFETH
ncbi:MAG: DUF4332 domain-containing protein [Chloroflexota bacterium]